MAHEAVEASHETEAIVGGYHGDAFRILGPHRLEDTKSGKERWTVRAFLPHASSVDLILDGKTIPMDKRHAHGFFVANVDQEPGAYLFQVCLWSGQTETIDDPYRFPPILTDYELYLHGEGTNYESYRSLGAHLATCQVAARENSELSKGMELHSTSTFKSTDYRSVAVRCLVMR